MRICMAPSSPPDMRTLHLLKTPDILCADDNRFHMDYRRVNRLDELEKHENALQFKFEHYRRPDAADFVTVGRNRLPPMRLREPQLNGVVESTETAPTKKAYVSH